MHNCSGQTSAPIIETGQVEFFSSHLSSFTSQSVAFKKVFSPKFDDFYVPCICQVRVTMDDLDLWCCVCVTSFERQLTTFFYSLKGDLSALGFQQRDLNFSVPQGGFHSHTL